jgi:hypothetical protein
MNPGPALVLSRPDEFGGLNEERFSFRSSKTAGAALVVA